MQNTSEETYFDRPQLDMPGTVEAKHRNTWVESGLRCGKVVQDTPLVCSSCQQLTVFRDTVVQQHNTWGK